MNAIDLQIGSIKSMFRDAKVDIESKECSLSKDNVRMFSSDDYGTEANWQQNDLQFHLLLDVAHTTCQVSHILINFTIDLYPLSISALIKNAVPNFIHPYKIHLRYSLSVAKE